MNINHKSDFAFTLALRDIAGGDLGWPAYPWKAEMYTTADPRKIYTASVDAEGNAVNCRRSDDGKVLILMDNHGLGGGLLMARTTIYVPDPAMPDGTAEITSATDTGIRLGYRGIDTAQVPNVAVHLPVIYGTINTANLVQIYPEIRDNVLYLRGAKALLDAGGELVLFRRSSKRNRENREGKVTYKGWNRHGLVKCRLREDEAVEFYLEGNGIASSYKHPLEFTWTTNPTALVNYHCPYHEETGQYVAGEYPMRFKWGQRTHYFYIPDTVSTVTCGIGICRPLTEAQQKHIKVTPADLVSTLAQFRVTYSFDVNDVFIGTYGPAL